MRKNKETESDRYCVFCEHSTPVIGDTEVLCRRRGIVGVRYSCRKFVYDPLKRVPKRKKLPDKESFPEV